jgi:predicted glycosyl hydrolase (DUF1957 family)
MGFFNKLKFWKKKKKKKMMGKTSRIGALEAELADMRAQLTWYKEQLMESLCREGLRAKYIDYCCTMKSDQPLTSVL